MKVLVAAVLALTAAHGGAQTMKRDYPGCDLKAQRTVKGEVGGAITDPLQAHLSTRAAVLRADLGTARKARRLTQAEANRLSRRIGAVSAGADGYTRQQGFLSAAELASYDRELDAVAIEVCRR